MRNSLLVLINCLEHKHCRSGAVDSWRQTEPRRVRRVGLVRLEAIPLPKLNVLEVERRYDDMSEYNIT